jgi:hypothetical protein
MTITITEKEGPPKGPLYANDVPVGKWFRYMLNESKAVFYRANLDTYLQFSSGGIFMFFPANATTIEILADVNLTLEVTK